MQHLPIHPLTVLEDFDLRDRMNLPKGRPVFVEMIPMLGVKEYPASDCLFLHEIVQAVRNHSYVQSWIDSPVQYKGFLFEEMLMVCEFHNRQEAKGKRQKEQPVISSQLSVNSSQTLVAISVYLFYVYFSMFPM